MFYDLLCLLFIRFFASSIIAVSNAARKWGFFLFLLFHFEGCVWPHFPKISYSIILLVFVSDVNRFMDFGFFENLFFFNLHCSRYKTIVCFGDSHNLKRTTYIVKNGVPVNPWYFSHPFFGTSEFFYLKASSSPLPTINKYRRIIFFVWPNESTSRSAFSFWWDIFPPNSKGQ